MSHLRKLGEKKWQIIIDLGYDEKGKRIRKFKTVNAPRSEAKIIMARMEAKLIDKPNVKDNITLEKHLREWIDVDSKSLGPLTEESYRMQLEAYIIPNLGHYKLKELTTKIIDDFYTEMFKRGKIREEGGLSRRSVRYLHTILRKALNKAINWDRLRENPTDGTSPPKRQRYRNKDVNPQHLIKIINLTDNVLFKDIFEFTLRTGLRRGEVLGLMRSDIDRNRKLISIMREIILLKGKGLVIKDLTKNDKAYTIPVGRKVIEILDKREQEQEKHKKVLGSGYLNDGFVFTWEDGRIINPDTTTHVFSRYSKKEGYTYSFHDLRHGFGAMQIIAGTHTKTLQHLLNHKTERTTSEIYAHIIEGQKTDAAQKIDDFF